MDMKASFGGADRKTILENCVRSKEAAIGVLKTHDIQKI